MLTMATKQSRGRPSSSARGMSRGKTATQQDKTSPGAQWTSSSSHALNTTNLSKTIAKRLSPATIARPSLATLASRTVSLSRTNKLAMNNRITTLPKRSDKPTTWDGYLRGRIKSSTQPSNASSFKAFSLQQFDPIRTLSFLTAELNAILQTYHLDKTVLEIFHEIESVLKRIENVSQPLGSANVTIETNLAQQNRASSCDSSTQTDKLYVRYHEKGVQTDQNDPKLKKSTRQDLLQSMFNEGSLLTPYNNHSGHTMATETTIQLNENYADRNQGTKEGMTGNQMKYQEIYLCRNCSQNDADNIIGANVYKNNIENELARCYEEVTALKLDIATLQNHLETANIRETFLIQELESRYKILQMELETLQDIVKKQTTELCIVQELSAKLKQSALKINSLEKSKLEANKVLVFTKLEKEKLAMLQRFQENQVDTLQIQLNKLTKIVSEQIRDIRFSSSINNLKKIAWRNILNRKNIKYDETDNSLILDESASCSDENVHYNHKNIQPSHYHSSIEKKQAKRNVGSFMNPSNYYECSSMKTSNDVIPEKENACWRSPDRHTNRKQKDVCNDLEEKKKPKKFLPYLSYHHHNSEKAVKRVCGERLNQSSDASTPSVLEQNPPENDTVSARKDITKKTVRLVNGSKSQSTNNDVNETKNRMYGECSIYNINKINEKSRANHIHSHVNIAKYSPGAECLNHKHPSYKGQKSPERISSAETYEQKLSPPYSTLSQSDHKRMKKSEFFVLENQMKNKPFDATTENESN